MRDVPGMPAKIVEDALAQFDALIVKDEHGGEVGSGPFSDALERALEASGYTIVKVEELERLRAALLWTLRNNGGECPADYPVGYAKAMKALLDSTSVNREEASRG